MKRLLDYTGGRYRRGVTGGPVGRSLIEGLNTATLLRDRGIHLRSIADGIDTATATGAQDAENARPSPRMSAI